MPTKMMQTWPETALTRVLEAFEQELLQAPEEEIMTVARELRMDPATRRLALLSFTFIGVVRNG
jgi:hypothetical protein